MAASAKIATLQPKLTVTKQAAGASAPVTTTVPHVQAADTLTILCPVCVAYNNGNPQGGTVHPVTIPLSKVMGNDLEELSLLSPIQLTLAQCPNQALFTFRAGTAINLK